MSLIRIIGSVALISSFAMAAFLYQQDTKLLYQADHYIQSITFANYANRGRVVISSNVEGKPSLEQQIAEADRLFNQDQKLKSLAYYQSLLEEDPNNNELLLRIGIVYLQEQQYSLAEEYFELVYADKETRISSDGAWFLGLLQTKYNNKKNAIKLFEEVIKNNGNYSLLAQKLLALTA